MHASPPPDIQLWFLVFFPLGLAIWLGWSGVIYAFVLGTCCCCCCCGGKLLSEFNDPDAMMEKCMLPLCCFPPGCLSFCIINVLFAGLAVGWTAAMTPVLIVFSPLWLALIAAGKCTFRDVRNLWLFCGNYFLGTAFPQMIIGLARGEDGEGGH